jgi:HD-like signal output (HDOD) protein
MMTLGAELAPDYKSLEALRHAIQKLIAKGAFKVPMMPQVASRVMAVVNDPNLDLADLSDLIHKDPSLAGRVLQAANSVLYRGDQEIGSLQEAVHRLGIKILSEIILSVSLRAGIYRVPGFEHAVNQLWRHSVASGLFGREIARLRGASEETAFLGGLLHAIGKPAVLQIVADFTQQHEFMVKPEVLETLLEEFHGTISAATAAQWELPEQVRIACSCYQDYAQAPSCQAEAAMTYLADRLAGWLASPEGTDPSELAQDQVLTFLELGPDSVQQVLGFKETVGACVAAIEK